MGTAHKKVLILASKLGYQTRGFADAAEALGISLEFGTDRCHKLEDPWSDGALALHFEEPCAAAEEIARQFKNEPPDAIVALGDRPTPTAAYAAHQLGLESNNPEAVERCRNKFMQRKTLQMAGIHVPRFFELGPEASAGSVLDRVEFPCVIKPLSLAASQGVIRANDSRQFAAAVARVRSLLASPEIQVTRESGLNCLLVENYIPGREVAIEGLLDHGKLRILAIFDKPDPLEGPYFEETIYVTPSRLASRTQEALRDSATQAVSALGLSHGPIHAEFRVNDAGPLVLEVAPRPIGGLCSRALRFGPGRISLEELILRHALRLGGTKVEREEEASGVMMIPVPRSGIFEGVHGIEAAEHVGEVTEIQITARLKDYLAAWPEGASYLGFIFARGATPEGVEASLRKAHSLLQFSFSPRLPVGHPATGKISA